MSSLDARPSRCCIGLLATVSIDLIRGSAAAGLERLRASDQVAIRAPAHGWIRSNSAAMWSAWSTPAPVRERQSGCLLADPRQSALSKRIGRAERVARLHNLSADFLIANMAAFVRERQRPTAALTSKSWLLCTKLSSVAGVPESAASIRALAGTLLAPRPGGLPLYVEGGDVEHPSHLTAAPPRDHRCRRGQRTLPQSLAERHCGGGRYCDQRRIGHWRRKRASRGASTGWTCETRGRRVVIAGAVGADALRTRRQQAGRPRFCSVPPDLAGSERHGGRCDACR